LGRFRITDKDMITVSEVMPQSYFWQLYQIVSIQHLRKLLKPSGEQALCPDFISFPGAESLHQIIIRIGVD
jgi:hypothetical protein